MAINPPFIAGKNAGRLDPAPRPVLLSLVASRARRVGGMRATAGTSMQESVRGPYSLREPRVLSLPRDASVAARAVAVLSPQAAARRLQRHALLRAGTNATRD